MTHAEDQLLMTYMLWLWFAMVALYIIRRSYGAAHSLALRRRPPWRWEQEGKKQRVVFKTSSSTAEWQEQVETAPATEDEPARKFTVPLIEVLVLYQLPVLFGHYRGVTLGAPVRGRWVLRPGGVYSQMTILDGWLGWCVVVLLIIFEDVFRYLALSCQNTLTGRLSPIMQRVVDATVTTHTVMGVMMLLDLVAPPHVNVSYIRWAYLACRLVVATDAVVGVGIPAPLNPLNFIPFYAGAAFHDFRAQMAPEGNFGGTLCLWDRAFGTDRAFREDQVRRRAHVAAVAAGEMRKAGAAAYHPGEKKKKKTQKPTAPAPLGFETCLVTGGAGMVGSRLMRMLLARGARRVVCLDRATPSPTLLDELGPRVACAKVDLAADDAEARRKMDEAFAGVEVVFHLAALVGPFFPHAKYDAVNVGGTRHVLRACRDAGVRVLVDCSSPSTRMGAASTAATLFASLGFGAAARRSASLLGMLAADGVSGQLECDLPGDAAVGPAREYSHEYAYTKAVAERLVTDANGSAVSPASSDKRGTGKGKGKLATCAVAPHQVYAAEDRLFLPAFVASARSGALRIFGAGDNIVSFTHADNVAHGLICAATTLADQGPASPAGGQFFVVTDGVKGVRHFWDCVDEAVVAAGAPSLWRKTPLPHGLLAAVAACGALYHSITGKFAKLTPFTLRMTTIDRFFCTAKAETMLGYRPIRDFDEAWPEAIKAVVARADAEAKEGKKKKKGGARIAK